MAQLKKILPSNPVSNFSQVAPEGGAGFKLLADGLSELYDRLEPAAMDEMAERGSEYGREMARKDMGGQNSNYTFSTSGGGGEANSRISQKLVDRGMAPHIADAFVMNFEDESGLNSGINEIEPLVEGSRGGFGLAQWTGPRRRSLEAFAAERGVDVANEDMQLDFLMSELEGSESRAGSEILASQDTASAATAIVNLFLRPSEEHRQRRTAKYQNATTNREPTISTSGGGAQMTKIRNADGKLEGRKYSPFAGPILRAHDAAAKVAYQAEVLNKSTGDIMELSSQFLTDPEGFAQAASEYIDGMVESTPDFMKASVRGVLEKEVSRRHLGVMDAKQREIRQRASNESAALVDRWSANLQEAIVSGDPYEVAEAQGRLDDLLQARERLPGLAWTQAQSANVFLDIERRSQTEMAKRQKEVITGYKDDFRLITEAAKRGQYADAEDLLNNPEAVAAHPELAREAAAFVAMRDNLPEFLAMKPSEQIAAIESMAAAPVENDLQMDVLDAARKVVADNVKAWNDDPVKHDFEVGQRTMEGPPPELPDFNTDNPESFIKGLNARREHMNMRIDEGYTTTRQYLSEEEATTVSAMMGKEAEPQIRAAISAAIVAGFGEDAIAVFDQLEIDRVTAFAGKMGAIGGDVNMAAKMLQGQADIDAGLIQQLPEKDTINAYNTKVGAAFVGIQGRTEVEADVMAAARALYAVDAKGLQYDSDAAKKIMEDSIQKALGQVSKQNGKIVTGGVQEIMGHNTLLPVNVRGDEANAALRSSLGGNVADPSTVSGTFKAIGQAAFGGDPIDNTNVWDSMTLTRTVNGRPTEVRMGQPLLYGEPIPQKLVDGGNVRIVPYQGYYRMEVTSGETVLNVENAEGKLFIFDLQQLMEAVR